MELGLLLVLVVLAVTAVRLNDLLAAVAVLGVYSLAMALLWCRMNALDVGFTEAAVGAGISTVLMLAAVRRVGRHEGPAPAAAATLTRPERVAPRLAPLLAVALVSAALLYGARDMPRTGDPEAPAHRAGTVAQHYLEHAIEDSGSPNVVTPVLGDYRGYDTMGETTVIFIAALAVVLLLRHAGRWPRGPRYGGDQP
jgi:multicomponent Na+:H+ antiporter subunit B